MSTRELTVGFHCTPKFYHYAAKIKDWRSLLEKEVEPYNRLAFTLSDYLINYTKVFDILNIHLSPGYEKSNTKGVVTGLTGAINQSIVDISGDIYDMSETFAMFSDFAYPYKLYFDTFVTHKPEFKPKLFGILKTFSVSVWVAIILVLVTMPFFNYVIFKRKDSLEKSFIHVFGVLFRQSSILKPTSKTDRLLIYAWVIGAMFLCLAYESVFFSFLAVPSVTQIKDIPELSRAVEKEGYHCIANFETSAFHFFTDSKEKKFKVIGRDLLQNNLALHYDKLKRNFILRKSNTQNLVLLLHSLEADEIASDDHIVSDDHFSETLRAMRVRKGFCCKELIEKFVHKMMASGLFFKYHNDRFHKIRLKRLLKVSQQDTSERKLTFTDLAPAFIFLLTGYIISFLVFIGEIISDRRKKRNLREKSERNVRNENIP